MNACCLMILTLGATLIATPPAVADSEYPRGLFENSPVVTSPYGARRQQLAPRARTHDGAHEDGSCHHYRDWSYPWPQPC
jgi:hypothetical protein